LRRVASLPGSEHACRPGPTGAREDRAPYPARAIEHQLLRDHAPEREAEDVDLGQTEAIEERDGVARHIGDVVWARRARVADPARIEQDHRPRLRQSVDESGVPGIHVAPE